MKSKGVKNYVVRNETSKTEEDDKESYIKEEEVAAWSPLLIYFYFFLDNKGDFCYPFSYNRFSI